MKTKLLLFFTFISISLSAQVNWSVTNTQQDDLIEEISLVNDVIWARNQGNLSFSISINQGKTWVIKQFPSEWSINTLGVLSAINETTAYIILSQDSGNSAKGLYKTTDAGNTWVRENTIYNNAGSFPNLVHFWNENEGFTMGDGLEIYYYKNGTWSASTLPTSSASWSINSSDFLRIESNTVYFTTNVSIFKSVDKGENWLEIAIPSFSNLDISKLTYDFKDDTNGLLFYNEVANTQVFSTSDGGTTWTDKNNTQFNNLSNSANKSVRYIPSLQKYIYTGANGLYYSDSDGNSWTKKPYFDGKNILGNINYSSKGAYIGSFGGEIYFYSNDLIIPDENFEQALIDLGMDTVLDGIVDRNNVNQVTTLDVSSKNISDTRGIEGFTNLENFGVSFNNITQIDIAQNITLKVAYVNDNQLAGLDVTALINLEELVFDRNQINSIDVSENSSLKALSLSGNLITSLDLSQNILLENYLWVDNNQLNQLDLANNPLLKILHLENNNLSKLNIKNGGNYNITEIIATGNANLVCLEVDDATYAASTFTSIDAQTSFSTDCTALSVVYIPDANMKAALVADTFINSNGDNEIQFFEAEAVTTTIIGTSLEIADLTGIEAFINITGLDVRKNNLTNVNLSKNTKLESLIISDNQLTTLDITDLTELTYINLGRNQLANVNFSKNTKLEILYANSNQLENLNTFNLPNLKSLQAIKNNISYVNFSNNTMLENILISDNNLTQIDLSKNTLLNQINIYNNQLTAIDISKNILLEYLLLGGSPEDNFYSGDIETNRISSLNVTNNTALKEIIGAGLKNISTIDFSQNLELELININSNNLTNLDISANDNLKVIAFGNNAITSIDLTDKPELIELYAWQTGLTTINLINNPKLEILKIFSSQLTGLDISNNLKLRDIDISDVRFAGALDLSNHTLLENYVMYNTLYTSVNLRNGNNTILTNVEIKDNANLTCVTVDDVSYATTNFTNVDAQIEFKVNCNVSADVTTIADINFEQALIDLGFDTNGLNGTILLSEAQAIDSLNIQDPLNNTLLPNVTAKIKSLQGIEFFTSLVSLEAGNNELSSVDLSQNTELTNLFLNDNQLTTIDVSKNIALERFGIMRNQFTSVDVSKLVNLKDLFMNGNQLSSIDVSTNTELIWLYVSDNQISNLDISNNTKIEWLYVWNNQINSLDVTILPELLRFYGNNNLFTTIDLSSNTKLERLSIYDGKLTSLDITNNTLLNDLRIYNNHLSNIDLTNNPELKIVWLEGNQFTELDLSNNLNIDNLAVGINPLTSLDVSALTAVRVITTEKTQITELNLSQNTHLEQLWIAENSGLTSIDLSANTKLWNLGAYNTGIVELDLGSQPIRKLDAQNNSSLTKVNLNNGFNAIVEEMNLSNNPNLTCVQVDDVAFATTNWTTIDISSVYNTDCGYNSAAVVNIPDVNMKAALVADTFINTNGDDEIQVSEAEAITQTLTGEGLGISDLTGIEAFVNITGLIVNNNNLTSIDISKNTKINLLNVGANQLTSINVSLNTALTKLEIWDNQIATLDVSKNLSIETLYVSGNNFTTIDVSNLLDLKDFSIRQNQISSIDISKNTKLISFDAFQNLLTGINLSKNPELNQLYLNNNSIINIDINQNKKLNTLFLNDNKIERAYLKNGNNTAITNFSILNNTNITCITVDDVSYSNTNWTNKDATATYNTDCNSVWEVYTTDANLNTTLITTPGLDGDGDGMITYEEAQAFTGDLDLSGQNITSVTGLEAFTNAASINISGNSITDISSLLNNSSVVVSSKSTGEKRSIARVNTTGIKKLNVANNLIEEIDISKVTSITELIISNNKLTYLNLNNNSNTNLVKVDVTENPNLTCIQVDNVANANANVNWKKDATASYNTYCQKAALSIQDFLKESISMYPNPATTKIQVSLINNLELKSIEIFNSIGRKVIKTNSDLVDVRNLSSGIYFVSVITDKGFINQKLIKK